MAAGYTKLNAARRLLIPSFSGRITYEEYSRALLWLIVLGAIIIGLCSVISIVLISSLGNAAYALPGIVGLAFLVSWISLMVRRLHDVGFSGHFMWLTLLCFVGVIIPVVMALGDTVEDNQYGPGDSSHSGGKFEDLKRSANLILHPESRLTFKEFGLATTILSFVYQAAESVISMIVGGADFLSNLSSGGDINAMMAASGGGASSFLLTILAIVYLVFYIRVGVHRLHDTGRSGHYFWLTLICGIGFIIPMILCYYDEDDDNMYGPKKSIDIDNDTNGFISNNQLDLNKKDECIE